MPQQNYLDELTPAFTPLLAIKEASRCLLCHDAPCSQACPAQTDPGKFIRSIYFRNFKGAAETIRENNALGAVCARVCPTEKLCQSGCTRAGVDTPIRWFCNQATPLSKATAASPTSVPTTAAINKMANGVLSRSRSWRISCLRRRRAACGVSKEGVSVFIQ